MKNKIWKIVLETTKEETWVMNSTQSLFLILSLFLSFFFLFFFPYRFFFLSFLAVFTHSFATYAKEVSCLLTVGNHVWSGSQDNSVKIWDKQTFAHIQTINTGFHVRSLMLVGNQVWIGGFKKLQVRLPRVW